MPVVGHIQRINLMGYYYNNKGFDIIVHQEFNSSFAAITYCFVRAHHQHCVVKVKLDQHLPCHGVNVQLQQMRNKQDCYQIPGRGPTINTVTSLSLVVLLSARF